MRITWYGHACFRLETESVSVVTDPYSPEASGMAPVTDPADFVVMSSPDDDAHSNFRMVEGSPHVVNSLEVPEGTTRLTDELSIWTLPTSEGLIRSDAPKVNAMYALRFGEFVVCHMGDVGTALSKEQLERFRGRVDVLLALAGGTLTIALPDLDAAIEEIAPAVVIPMHYRTPRCKYAVGRVDAFLDRHADEPVVLWDNHTFELSARSVPRRRTIVVLSAQHG
jgi:L-ascorbate metabolism protein UlaG (beta-lactamase superfamily)